MRRFARTFERLLREEGGWTRVWTSLAMAIALSGGAVIYNAATSDPPAAGTANLWIDTTTGNNACTRSSTPVAYDSTTACDDLVEAYGAAANDDLVLIKAGSYGDQNTGPDASINQCCVTFRPEDGAAVTISSFYDWGASYTDVDGSTGSIEVPGGFRIAHPSSNSTLVTEITLQHMHTETQSQIEYASEVTLRDLDIGFWCDTNGSNGEDSLRFNDPTTTSGDSGDPFNIVVEDSTIGEMCWRNDPTPHPDCVAMSAGNNVTFRRNKFYECASQGLYLISEEGGNIHDVLIENNWFGDCSSPGGFSVCANSLILDVRSPGLSDITVRNNSFAVGAQPMRVSGGTSSTNIQIYGNAGEGPGCEDTGDVSYNDNVWDDTTCDASDTQADPGFVSNASGSSLDLHLSSTSSPACDQGAATYPSDDYDGDSRPQDGSPEAGADEKAGC